MNNQVLQFHDHYPEEMSEPLPLALRKHRDGELNDIPPPAIVKDVEIPFWRLVALQLKFLWAGVVTMGIFLSLAAAALWISLYLVKLYPEIASVIPAQ